MNSRRGGGQLNKEAVRLSQHFENEGTDRVAWDRNPILFYPGGKRKLYGYMATKGDMDIFNKHSKGKVKLKFEMVSYHEKVVDQLKQMNEENQQLHWYKDKAVTHQMHAKALEESIDLVSKKLRKKEVEDRIKKERTQQHCEELEEALDSQEQFFKDQLKLMKYARNAKESEFDKLQEEDRVRVEGSYSAVDPQREEKLEEIKEFQEEREKLKSMYMKKKIELEKWFDTELTQLMDKYTHIN
ncbi:putative XS domain-containing protein [Helianthus annuus]|uniref:XS domain-containing protein n=1 Tax=Helianthus annuus TaxID=4232 RepID=A0A9K3N5L3_HELAN|nr:putative XS domain-containing protein [Helianthus annuus]KAJ0885019.1 putative XS domain-containing protein [Helianthus annuus]